MYDDVVDQSYVLLQLLEHNRFEKFILFEEWGNRSFASVLLSPSNVFNLTGFTSQCSAIPFEDAEEAEKAFCDRYFSHHCLQPTNRVLPSDLQLDAAKPGLVLT